MTRHYFNLKKIKTNIFSIFNFSLIENKIKINEIKKLIFYFKDWEKNV